MPDPNWWNGAPGELVGDHDKEHDSRDPDGHASCDHPQHWRWPEEGLIRDGSCKLCGASASTIQREEKTSWRDQQVARYLRKAQ